MKASKKHYRLTSTHYYKEENLKERQIFERLISVKILKEAEGVIYDSNLKMYFEDEKKSGYLIEMRVEDFQLLLYKRMKQAEDILHRINYIFDKVIIKVNKAKKKPSVRSIKMPTILKILSFCSFM